MSIDETDEDILNAKFDLDLIKNNIKEYTSKKLCEMIVCDRYLNINNSMQIICMEELAVRRTNGDTFDFESYIDESLNSLPKLNFNMATFDLSSIINMLSGFKK